MRYGEIRSTEKLIDLNANLFVLFPYTELEEKNTNTLEFRDLLSISVSLNPTQHFWKTLLECGFPGIKKSLIFSNPAQLKILPSLDTFSEWGEIE